MYSGIVLVTVLSFIGKLEGNIDSGNVIDVDDILSEDFMPGTLLMLENAKNITQQLGHGVKSSNLTSKYVPDGTLNIAMETMGFHRSKMNEYLCRNYIAEQIVNDMTLSRIKRRMGTNLSNLNSISSNLIKNALLVDEGSSNYKDWLSKSTTLEDIYRHYDKLENRNDDQAADEETVKDDEINEDYDGHILGYAYQPHQGASPAKLGHSGGGASFYPPQGHGGSSGGGGGYPYHHGGHTSGGGQSYPYPQGGHSSYGGGYGGSAVSGHGHEGGYASIEEHEHVVHGHQPKYQVVHEHHEESHGKKDHDLSDLFEIALTALAYLSFGLFIVQVIMCISMSQNTTTATPMMMPMSMSPTNTGTGTGMTMTGGGTTGTGGGMMTSTGGGTTGTGGGSTGTGGGTTGTGGGSTGTGGGSTGTGGGTTGTGGGSTGTGGGSTGTGGGSTGTGGGSTGTGGGSTGTGGGSTGTGGGSTGTGGGSTGTGGGSTGTGGGATGTGGGSTGTGGGSTGTGGGSTGTGGGSTGTGGGSTGTGGGSTGTGGGTTGTGDGGTGTGGNGGTTGDGGTRNGRTTVHYSAGTGTGSATGTGMMDTGSGAGTSTGKEASTVADELNFRVRRSTPIIVNPNNEALNELARKILTSIEAAVIINEDDGNCLRHVLCENNKYSRRLTNNNKIFIPIWSLGMSWLAGRISKNVNPAVAMLDTLKASILGLGKAHCEIIYKNCNLRKRKNDMLKRKRRNVKK